MDISKLVKNSFKYPFRNIAKLPIICILFFLIAIIPIGMVADNNYVVMIGVVAFFLFVLIVPGYFLSVVKTGSIGSSALPSVSLVNNIYDSVRVVILRIAYMIIPVVVFFLGLTVFGPTSREFLFNLKIPEFLATVGFVFLLILVIYIIFEFLLFFAKARLAYFNSLPEALKVNKVIGDIRTIGLVNIIKWVIVMAVLINVVAFVSSFVMAIPYVGFLIYICIVIPIIESIGNYSLGLIYSSIARNNGELDFNQFEKEIELLKYRD